MVGKSALMGMHAEPEKQWLVCSNGGLGACPEQGHTALEPPTAPTVRQPPRAACPVHGGRVLDSLAFHFYEILLQDVFL